MIKGKTRTGFKFEIDERVTKDWRLLDAIGKASSSVLTDQISATSELIDLLLGNEKIKLMEHIQNNNDGFIPADALEAELFDIIQGANETKNSQSSPES